MTTAAPIAPEKRTRFNLFWTSPAMRKLFMAPRNHLRMQEALLSLLAGDLFRGTPIHWSLRAFKAVYYATTLLDAKDNFSKQGLFMEGWERLYGDRIEWVGLSNDGRVTRVVSQARGLQAKGEPEGFQPLKLIEV